MSQSMRPSHNVVDERKKDRTIAQARKVLEPQWCPASLTKTQRRRLQKLHKNEIDKEKKEKAHDEWFNKARPMTKHHMTWRKKTASLRGGQRG
jgi:hypothetical protein